MEGLLLGLAVLVCPVGMGLMMWFMAKGARKQPQSDERAPADIAALRAEHRRLGDEITHLERH